MELEIIQHKIYEIRGYKVMLDFDLAILYGTETKILKQSVKRNINRFPEDFMFEITKGEYDSLRSQFVTLKTGRGQHSKYMPFAFTEQGIAMLSSVLKSENALKINIAIMRAFVAIRQFAINYSELQKRIDEIEVQMPEVYKVLNYLLDKDKLKNDTDERKRIGYKK